MTEFEKLKVGLEYDYFDKEIIGEKNSAVEGCKRLHELDFGLKGKQLGILKELFGEAGQNPIISQCHNVFKISWQEEYLIAIQ